MSLGSVYSLAEEVARLREQLANRERLLEKASLELAAARGGAASAVVRTAERFEARVVPPPPSSDAGWLARALAPCLGQPTARGDSGGSAPRTPVGGAGAAIACSGGSYCTPAPWSCSTFVVTTPGVGS